MRFKANGKLLLTGEYFVLDGTKALAIPTSKGQSMEVSHHRSKNELYWNSYRSNGELWLSVKLAPQQDGEPLELIKGEAAAVDRLKQIIQAGIQLNPKLPSLLASKSVITKLDFPSDWGLGSSSTLIWMLAQWWQVDPFLLLAKTFGGSGYDLACAGTDSAIEFWRDAEKTAHWMPFSIQANWVKNTFFVHLNRKQNSREGIQRYRSQTTNAASIAKLSRISTTLQTLLLCEPQDNEQQVYQSARDLLDEHEEIVSQFIGLPKVKTLHFSDFEGTVKSLGAWGGDFVWVLPPAGQDSSHYFIEKGYTTILSWEEMVG